MELTSDALVNSLLAAGSLSLLLTLWLWPRLARQRPLPMLGRIALLTVTQVTVLAVLAVSVNNSFGFYTSWDGLLHPGGAALSLTSAGRPKSAAPATEALVAPTAEGGLETVADLPKGTPEEVGKVESIRVTGKESGLSDQMFIYLPPEYFNPKYSRMRFPVLVALAGYPGTALHLLSELRLPQTAWELQRTGQMVPTVIVMARPTVAEPRNTECVNVPNGPQTETWFAKDVPAALRATYRLGREAPSWGIFGYSTGGGCALRLTMRYPDVFGSAAGLHADFAVPEDYSTGGNLFGGDRTLLNHSDLTWRLNNLPVPDISLLLVSTRKEEDYAATQAFLGVAQQASAAHPELKVDSLFLDDGGHNFDSWRRELPASLEWMSDHLATPQDREPRQ
ncbi:alpha/beta hydrolase [Kitasatospora herbaricolor]|uniref:Alpha/beta hydrolase-fold protein n=1 Tax=Kitasatospora herbaricolor TaxID=68217 RepID=A0ABZ1W974_9ACTN|nr:alpha/beta hydrolase-fold protein [Kitasatospora herbaricolor]